MANAFQINAFQNDAFQVYDDVGGTIAPAGLATVTVAAQTAGSSYSSVVLADSPVGYWRLGEAAGTTADNLGSGGSAIDGTYVGSPTLGVTGLLTGDSDTAVTFNGSTQWVLIPDNAALDVGDTLTIEAVANVDTGSAWCPIYWKGTGTGRFEVGWSRSFTDMAVYINGVGNVSSIEHLTAGHTYHLVATKDGGSYFKLYINGVECTYTYYTAGTVVDNAQDAYIGYGPDPAYFDGTLDEVALYDYALTPAQVAAHYAASVAAAGVGATASIAPSAGSASVAVATLTPTLATLYANAGLATVAVAAYDRAAVGSTTANAGLATVAVSAYGSSSEVFLRSSHALEYCIELFDGSGSGRGPGSKIAELWDARNIGWSRYDRLPGKAFATLYQTSEALSLLDPLVTHVRITRVGSSNVEVYNGQFIDYAAQGDDVVLTFYDYITLFSTSLCDYRTMYATKLLGSEIVSPEVAIALINYESPLGFVTVGTIEDPLGTDDATPIKTNAQFGTLLQPRLQLLYDLSEMGRANTDHWVTYEISRTAPFTFNFRRDAGTTSGIGLVLNGTVSDYSYLPNWTSYRNLLSSVGLNSTGGTGKINKGSATEMDVRGMRHDVATIGTLLGIVGAATEADQQQAALSQLLYKSLNRRVVFMARLVPGSLEPFTGWDIPDKVTMEISNGTDSLSGWWRIVGVRALYTEAGEDLGLFVEKP